MKVTLKGLDRVGSDLFMQHLRDVSASHHKGLVNGSILAPDTEGKCEVEIVTPRQGGKSRMVLRRILYRLKQTHPHVEEVK